MEVQQLSPNKIAEISPSPYSNEGVPDLRIELSVHSIRSPWVPLTVKFDRPTT